MLPAAKEEMLSPLAPSSAWSDEEIFSFAAGVGLAALGTHQGAYAAQGKKPHRGVFPQNRELRIGETWAKWSQTHQDSETWWRKTAPGSALDANGNTLTDAQGRTFTWDFENRLTQAVNPSVGTTTFKYDPFGRRIQKSGPLGTTDYLYDGPNAVVELDQSGKPSERATAGKCPSSSQSAWCNPVAWKTSSWPYSGLSFFALLMLFASHASSNRDVEYQNLLCGFRKNVAAVLRVLSRQPIL